MFPSSLMFCCICKCVGLSIIFNVATSSDNMHWFPKLFVVYCLLFSYVSVFVQSQGLLFFIYQLYLRYKRMCACINTLHVLCNIRNCIFSCCCSHTYSIAGEYVEWSWCYPVCIALFEVWFYLPAKCKLTLEDEKCSNW